MNNFDIIYNEMAIPSENIRMSNWYHGTSKENVQKIISDGYLKPSQLITKNTKRQMSPQFNKVYLTNNLVEGIGYAFFRNGSHFEYPGNKKIDGTAYLVIIDGNDMKNVHSDEDIIADLILQTDENNNPKYRWLNYLAMRVAPKAYKKYMDMGDYGYGTQLGKILIKYLSDEQHLKLIEIGRKLAHEGNIPIKKVWELDMSKINEYKNNINGFKEISKRIK